jgi:hypothetical protein
MTAKSFFLRHSFTFRCMVALHYPLSKALIDAFRPCFDGYYLAFNPHISDDVLKALAIEPRDKRYNSFEKYFGNVLVSTFLEQDKSPIPYLDDNLMSGDLDAKTLARLLNKGYSFKSWQLSLNCLRWTFDLYDLIYLSKDAMRDFNVYSLGNSYFYDTLFKPYLTDDLIKEVLTEKYQADINPINMKYYQIKQGDLQEMVSLFLLKQDIELLDEGKHQEVGDQIDTLGKWDNLVVPSPTNTLIKGQLENNYSTLPLLPDFVKISPYNWGIRLGFSERVKNVLEQFVLPPHRFTPIACTWNERTQKRFNITETFTYYAFMMDSRCLWENLDYKTSSFIYLKDLHREQGFVNDFVQYNALTVNNFDDLIRQRKASKEWLKIVCTQFVSPQNWDAVGYDFTFLINEDIKKALQKLQPIAMQFVDVEEVFGHKALHFNLLGAEAEVHRQHNAKIIQNIENEPIKDIGKTKIEVLRQQQQAKVTYLEAHLDLVKTHYEALNDANSISEKEADVRAKEIELKAIFPRVFRNKLLKDKLPKTMKKYYEIYPLERIASVGSGEHGWQENSPEAINGVGIGNNGCGDYIGFLLEQNHYFQLDARLVFFSHETATVEDL